MTSVLPRRAFRQTERYCGRLSAGSRRSSSSRRFAPRRTGRLISGGFLPVKGKERLH